MENFAKAKNTLLSAALVVVLSLGGYIWSGHVSAEAAQHAAQVKAQEETNAEVRQLREIVIRLDSYIQHQVELNEWFVTEHQRTNRRGN